MPTALARHQRLFVIMGGPPASGKTTQTRVLARVLRDVVLPSRERLVVVSGDVVRHLAVDWSRAKWQVELRQRCLLGLLGEAFRLRCHAILDDVLDGNAPLEEVLAAARLHAIEPIVVALSAERSVLLARNELRDAWHRLSSEELARRIDCHVEIGPVDLRIDTSELTIDETASAVFREVATRNPWLYPRKDPTQLRITVDGAAG